MATSNTTSGGIGFAGLLCILFIGLKLTGYIAWSWFWVLFPVTLPLTIIACIGVIALIVYLYDK